MKNADDIITADPDIIVTVIEGLLISISVTAPNMLEYLSDYAAELKKVSNNLERMLDNDN